MPEYKAPTPTRCPFADSCWMGGGSYACVKTPPFCKEPLIPKETRLPPYIPEPSPVFIETAEQAEELLGGASPLSVALTEALPSAIKQGELF